MRWSCEHGMVVRRFGDGPELVWIHGLGEWSVSFDAIAGHPALVGFTHVLVDLPGYGRSAWPATPTAAAGDRADSLVEHADRLVGWLAAREAAVVAGHSMGGVLATLIAERIEVLAVVDIDGNLSRGDCTFSAEAVAYTVEDFVGHGFATMRGRVYDRGLSSPALRGYHAALTAASPTVFHANASDLVALSATETLAPRLAALTAPVLFVAGVPDGICARSQALLDAHHVRWCRIEPAGHWPYVDQPDRFAAEIATFLGPLRSAAS